MNDYFKEADSMKIQDMSFVGEHHQQPEKIIQAAISTIGEDVNFVLWYLEEFTKSKNINLTCPSVREWIYLCRLLYLDLNSYSLGYVKRIHLVHLWQALMGGTYRWRNTAALQNFIIMLTEFEDDNYKFQLDYHVGGQLHGQIKQQWEERKAQGETSV